MQSPPKLAIPSELTIGPRVPPLGGSHHWGRVAPPIAALSGSPPKAPGSAGGYLLRLPLPIGRNSGPVVTLEASSQARTAFTGQATEPGTIAMVWPAPSWSVFDRRTCTRIPP